MCNPLDEKGLLGGKPTPDRPRKIVSLWSVQGSNLRPPVCKPGALPAELTPFTLKYKPAGSVYSCAGSGSIVSGFTGT